MSILVINRDVLEHIQQVKACAAQYKLARSVLDKLGQENPPFKSVASVIPIDAMTVTFADGEVIVCLTCEEHPPHWCWHLSIRLESGDVLPKPVTRMIIGAFGFSVDAIQKAWVFPIPGKEHAGGMLNMLIPFEEWTDWSCN